MNEIRTKTSLVDKESVQNVEKRGFFSSSDMKKNDKIRKTNKKYKTKGCSQCKIDKMVENAHYMCVYANYIKKRDAIIGS